MATGKAFRIGKVQGYLRGEVWYLCYYEAGKRKRPKIGPITLLPEAGKSLPGCPAAKRKVPRRRYGLR